MRQAVLRRLIEERLIAQEAKRMKLAVGSDEVAERLRAIRQRLETPEAYEQMLREASLSEEQLKQQIREQLLAQKAIDRQVRSKLMVSPYELAKASASATVLNPGEEVRASHLLIRVGAARPAAHASALITQLHERLRRGEAFETLAREYSDDPHAEAGGALGWVRQGELLPELDEALFRLKPGELSEPIQTRLGFHLVKVLERRNISELEAAEAHQRLVQRVYQAKFAEALTQWLEELKQQAYIQILDE
jgi:peptidyl-prolyl cis-trans isomerase SurA